MTFYTDPAFFVLLAVAVVPAFALGVLEKPLRLYGFAVSIVFLAFLFSKDLVSLAAFLFYLALASVATFAYLRVRSQQEAGAHGSKHSTRGQRMEGEKTVPERQPDAAREAAPDQQPADSSAAPEQQPIPDEQPAPGQQPSSNHKPVHVGHAAYPLALIAVIAPLFIYKIGAIFDQNILGFLGISYITFKAVQVVLEIHDGLIKELSPLDYLYLLVFFPSFTSGPILRSRPFVDDVRATLPRADYLELARKSVVRFIIGAFYKFVCSSVFSIAIWFIPRALGTGTFATDMLGQVGSAWAYALFLFFDFAGYSLMAIGVGGLLGVHVPDNFRAPFLSVDIKDFWNRWHISLSWWLRDYVFMRVVRIIRRKKLVKSRLTASCIGYMANMTLMGLWHGITPNYFVYGLYHGALLSANEAFQKTAFYKRHKDQLAFKVCSWFVTMNLVVVGLALFSGQIAIGS